MRIPDEARRRIASDAVAWLTTVTDSGAPAPNPVWFVPDGDDLIVFSEPTSRRVHNLAARPRVALHFNSDPAGTDVVIINGTATLTPGQVPSDQPGFVDKYRDAIRDELATTVEEIDATYSTRITISLERVRLTPGA